MAKLVELDRDTFYIEGRVNIGVVKTGKGVIMIDTGIDDDSARRALNILKSKGLEIIAVVNTHSHADHIGGNHFIKRRTGVPIYAPQEEIPFIEHPVLEPVMLYGGWPPTYLTTKMYMAKPSKAQPLSELKIKDLEAIELPGHSPRMVGIIHGEILFTADTFFPQSIIEKYKIPYSFDPQKALSSLKKLEATNYKLYVPSHGKPVSEITDVITSNIIAIQRVRDEILALLEGEAYTTCRLVAEIFNKLGINLRDPAMYILNTSALRGYLTWLQREGKIVQIIEDNIIKWTLK